MTHILGNIRNIKDDKNNLVKELFEANCIKLGQWTLKSGEISKYYFDIKNIISYPFLLKKIGDALHELLGDYDIICGIPYGGLPIATYISTQYNKPLIYLRDKAKTYGMQNLIEGEYKASDRCVIIDDVITSGFSINEAINILSDKVIISDVAVVLNRQESNESMSTYPIKSLLYKNDIIRYRLDDISQKKNSNICFAADITDPYKFLEILNKIGPYIVICKIHFDIFYLHHFGGDFKENLIAISLKHNFLIMEDRKFNDISSIVSKQFMQFRGWVDLITVHSLATTEVISQLSGVLIVANMSNNDYNFKERALELANSNPNNVIGFITQERIDSNFICMTPGISLKNHTIGDQNYRTINNIDTDYIIIGRALYESENVEEEVQKFLRIQKREQADFYNSCSAGAMVGIM